MIGRLKYLKYAALLVALTALPLQAASATKYVVSGDLVLTSIVDNGALQAGVEAALLARVADGTPFRGVFEGDLDVSDVAPGDANLGDYRGFVADGAMSIGAFASTPGTHNCLNPAIDCRQEVANDVPAGSTVFDRVGILSGLVDMDDLTAAVAADSGAVANSQFTDFDDSPILASLFIGGSGLDLFSSDGVVDPLSGLFSTGGLSLFLTSLFNEPGSPLQFARYNFELRNVSVEAVPVPAALPLAATGLAVFGAAAWRRRARRVAAR